jgi:hypothetical protein
LQDSVNRTRVMLRTPQMNWIWEGTTNPPYVEVAVCFSPSSRVGRLFDHVSVKFPGFLIVGVAACADAEVLPHTFQRIANGPTQEYYPNTWSVDWKGMGDHKLWELEIYLPNFYSRLHNFVTAGLCQTNQLWSSESPACSVAVKSSWTNSALFCGKNYHLSYWLAREHALIT